MKEENLKSCDSVCSEFSKNPSSSQTHLANGPISGGSGSPSDKLSTPIARSDQSDMSTFLLTRRNGLRFVFSELLLSFAFQNRNVCLASESKSKEIERKFERILGRYQTLWKVPSLLAELGAGNERYSYSAGATSHTVFPLASVSKVFTSCSILLLAEEHKLSLKDSIRAYFEHLPPQFEQISLLNLVTHTSGLALSGGDAQHRSEYLSNLGNAGLRFRPGERMEYNNPAYILLGWIAEKVSSQPLAQLMRTQIFQPTNMNDTAIPANGFDGYEKGHRWSHEKLVPASVNLEFQTMGGTGGLVSSLADLAKFASALLDAQILSRSSLSRMFEPMMLNSGHPSGTSFCWRLGQHYSSRVYEKNGNIEGFSSWLALDPGRKSFLILLTDLGGLKMEELSRELFKLV